MSHRILAYYSNFVVFFNLFEFFFLNLFDLFIRLFVIIFTFFMFDHFFYTLDSVSSLSLLVFFFNFMVANFSNQPNPNQATLETLDPTHLFFHASL